VSSENPSGADNQQETVRSMFDLDPRWVTGFVDGEGCFSVSIHRNPNARSTGGWQLHPVFHVYQHERHRDVLEAQIPFFEHHPLVVKAGNFRRFAAIVTAMRRKEHLDTDGFERLVKLADAMNANGKQRSRRIDEILTGSSETARQAPSSTPLER
jgi:LAGLIDADG endonuclease